MEKGRRIIMAWFGMGYGHGAVITVKNNTDNEIQKVTFIYNQGDEISIKNIQGKSDEHTGITAMYGAENIRMLVDGCDKEYLIKSHIDERNMAPITININNISNDKCSFELYEEEARN